MALALLMRRALRPLRITISIVIVTAWIIPEISAAFVFYAFGTQGGLLRYSELRSLLDAAPPTFTAHSL